MTERRIYRWMPNDLMQRAGVEDLFVIEVLGSTTVLRVYEYSETFNRVYLEKTGTLVELVEIKERDQE